MSLEARRRQREKFKDWRWTQGETAQAFDVDRTTIHEWQKRGLPCERKGREVLFRPHLAFAWLVGRGVAEEKAPDIEDALSLIVLGRCGSASKTEARQACVWLAEDMGVSPAEALVALGELIGRRLIS